MTGSPPLGPGYTTGTKHQWFRGRGPTPVPPPYPRAPPRQARPLPFTDRQGSCATLWLCGFAGAYRPFGLLCRQPFCQPIASEGSPVLLFSLHRTGSLQLKGFLGLVRDLVTGFTAIGEREVGWRCKRRRVVNDFLARRLPDRKVEAIRASQPLSQRRRHDVASRHSRRGELDRDIRRRYPRLPQRSVRTANRRAALMHLRRDQLRFCQAAERQG